ncbi:MAG: HI0074 family nucleotidyltransferase substrate-binding subunit [Synergistaceae bacterium]|nr:HI0074 family nucleotidyltransferase substrate-binding subunit [Synergistaceae bacterium]MBP9627247.1 HI0074 family nucleotidyltransferase substrate-binding subunit [Synergistaceae bacterium]MBP9958417.1 HI0074 family nucleotidyltransferase substrate-binding subunit [Synergistaceae bacterium]
MDLDMKIVDDIIRISQKYKEIHKIVLFGSRARGDNTAKSDVDLAIYTGKSEKSELAHFILEMEDIKTLLKIDIVEVNENLSEKMVSNIEKDGVVLLDKMSDKRASFKNALARLNESILEYDQTKSSSVRDGAIQRFEFSTELAWKTAKEFLTDEGFVDLNSPKSVMRQAFASGLIDHENHWVDLLNDRNRTSHIYKEELADEIYNKIVTVYYGELMKLLQRLETL